MSSERAIQGDEAPKTTLHDLIIIINDLQSELETEREHRRQLEAKLEEERQAREEAIRNEQIERTKMLQRQKDELREEVTDLHDSLRAEQKTRTRADAEIRSRLSYIADELDVEVDDEELMAHDKLLRLLRNGAEDVVSNAYPVHERAREVLKNLDDWGTLISDKNGKRVRLTAPEVSTYLKARYDREFSTSEVKRIFVKLAEFAADSPRKVRKDKNQDGHHRLTIWQPETLLKIAEGMRE